MVRRSRREIERLEVENERLRRWLQLIATARPTFEDKAEYLQRKARMALDGFSFN